MLSLISFEYFEKFDGQRKLKLRIILCFNVEPVQVSYDAEVFSVFLHTGNFDDCLETRLACGIEPMVDRGPHV